MRVAGCAFAIGVTVGTAQCGADDFRPRDAGDGAATESGQSGSLACSSGEIRPARDGCNTCRCGEDGQWVCTQQDCPECPPPRDSPDVVCPDLSERYAKNPLTGRCCYYASECASPHGWSVYDDPVDCGLDCLCDQLPEWSESHDVAGTSIMCLFNKEPCPRDAVEAFHWLCSSASEDDYLEIAVGCGMVGLSLSGYRWVFADLAILIGRESYSDVPSPPCQTRTHIAGRPFVCDTQTTCSLRCSDGLDGHPGTCNCRMGSSMSELELPVGCARYP